MPADGTAQILTLGLVACSSVVCVVAIAWAVWYFAIRPARLAKAVAEAAAAKAVADAADAADAASPPVIDTPENAPPPSPVPAISCTAAQGANIPDIYNLGDGVYDSTLALCCALARTTPGASGWTLSPDNTCQLKTSTAGEAATGYVSGSVSGTLISAPLPAIPVKDAPCLTELPELVGRATPPFSATACIGIKMQYQGQCWQSSGERWVSTTGCPAEGMVQPPTIEDIKLYTEAVDVGAPTLASTTPSTPSCQTGMAWLDGECVKTSPGCMPGFIYVNGLGCRPPSTPVPPSTPPCADGSKWLASSNGCVKTSPGCMPGYIYVNGIGCRPPGAGVIPVGPGAAPTPTCPAGSKWLASKGCVKTSPGCTTPGHIYVTGVGCRPPSTGVISVGPGAAPTPTCAAGSKWLASKGCVKTSPGCTTPGHIYVTGVGCRPPSTGVISVGPGAAPTPTCAAGSKWLASKGCVKTSPGCTTPGHIYVTGVGCRPPSTGVISVGPSGPATPSAPKCNSGTEWLASANACAKTSPGCSPGQIFVTGTGCRLPKDGAIIPGASPSPPTSSPKPAPSAPRAGPTSAPPAGPVAPPYTGKQPSDSGSTKLTNYWVPIEGQTTLIDGCKSVIGSTYKKGEYVMGRNGAKSHAMKDCKGTTLTTVDAQTFDACYCEGTCILGGVTYNIQKEGKNPCFSKTTAKWGLGNRDNGLVPFVSCTADKQYPSGATLYIQALNGLKLPSGQVHNGCIRVDDECGDGCGNDQVDFFVGTYANYKALQKAVPNKVSVVKKSCSVGSYNV